MACDCKNAMVCHQKCDNIECRTIILLDLELGERLDPVTNMTNWVKYVLYVLLVTLL